MSMIVDLTGVLKETGNKLDLSGSLDLDDVKYLGEDFHFIGTPLINGSIFNNGKSLILKAKVDLCLGVRCARCMQDLEESFSFELEEALVREEDVSDPDGDQIVFTGSEIDLTEIVQAGFFMNVPGKFLCSENCKGLCPDCGVNLNLESCTCKEEVIDPRWESLKKIMDSNED